MNISENALLDLLESKDLHFSNIHNLTPDHLSYLYTSCALLVTMMEFLREELWLKKKSDKISGHITSYCDFITPYFYEELLPLYFLKDYLIQSGERKIKEVVKDSKNGENKILAFVMLQSSLDKKSLNDMSILFLKEESDQIGRQSKNLGHKGLRLYRTFDKLDELFLFNYQLDMDMVVDHKEKERLYERAGVGVQSGYSTILLAINEVDIHQGAKVIDLGSGYGRVGLVYSLLRPDIDFTGYEFVDHRVGVANKACVSLGLQEGLNFETQDLSLESFKIPNADIYYLYDPFTKETYHYVLEQIVLLSKSKKIIIVTKGNARNWLLEISKKNSWPKPVVFDQGNLCVFRSE